LSGYNLRGASDYKLLDRKVVNAWRSMGERNIFFRGMTAWLGFHRVQIPFEVPERAGGRSRWSIFQLFKLAVNGITSFHQFLYILLLYRAAYFSFCFNPWLSSSLLKVCRKSG
jgi:hypothetical protein